MSQPYFFTIQEISNRLNIPKSTLRFWEKELDGIIKPTRTPGGQRRYNFSHLLTIQEISKLRKQGLSISEIKAILRSGNEEMELLKVTNPIDFLADQVSELVKEEIKRFFKQNLVA